MHKTMSLVGGLDMYESLGTRYKSDVSPTGRKVYFLNKNGYEGERERANKLFGDDRILTINEIYVGRSRSEVEFLEHPNLKFNTVMFADVDKEVFKMTDEQVKKIKQLVKSVNKEYIEANEIGYVSKARDLSNKLTGVMEVLEILDLEVNSDEEERK